MQNFISLPEEKQKNVVDAALAVFGRNGYKKASVGQIAAAAGLSKGMMFYYFGTKKAMYLHLIDRCTRIIMDEIESKLDHGVTDFFDRLAMIAQTKMSLLKHHPAILSFMYAMFVETDEEVRDDLRVIKDRSARSGWALFLNGADVSRFRDGIDAALLIKLMTWAAEGFSSGLPAGADPDALDALYQDFCRCLDALKAVVYKP